MDIFDSTDENALCQIKNYFKQIEDFSKKSHFKFSHNGYFLLTYNMDTNLIYGDLDKKLHYDKEKNKFFKPIMHSLLAEGVPIPDIDTTDIKKKDIHHIFEMDRSQEAALREASAGNSFHIIGPPGTGKSQTITNIITSFVIENKSVLFVTQKKLLWML